MASRGHKTRTHAMDLFNQAGAELSGPAVGNAFQGLQQQFNPFVNQLLGQQGLIAQQGANAIGANLGRAGLGNTGLGAALGGGLRSGVALQGSNLRARVGQDILKEALTNQRAKASALLQQSTAFGTSEGAQFSPGVFEAGGIGQQVLGGAVQAGATALGGPVGGAVAGGLTSSISGGQSVPGSQSPLFSSPFGNTFGR